MAKAPPEQAELTPQEIEAGLRVARNKRVAVFIVAYNHETLIKATLQRIPEKLRELLSCIYVIDDRSSDATTKVARGLREEIPQLEVFTTPYNQGYGGNQKLGYRYAIDQGFDVVVLLHGDGQYAPEVLPRILAAFEDEETAAVFGSRMMVPGAARRGGMPFYKRIGNRILTYLENRLLRSQLTEFHSGYRAYSVKALSQIPFSYNTGDFHFDTEIIIQLLGKKMKIVEVPIPTYYGDEICHVNGIGYAFNCIRTVLRSLANRVCLVYHPKFDLEGEHADYEFKSAPTSLHQFVIGKETNSETQFLELGAGKGDIGLSLHERGAKVLALDMVKPDRELPFPFIEEDLNAGFARDVIDKMGRRADTVIALDVIEHLSRPEKSLQEIKRCLVPGGKLLASTGNVAYVIPRLGLFVGQFNYGKKGILDLTHQRLFTVRSFCRTLEGEGFHIEKIRGFGPPIEDMVGKSGFWRMMDRFASFLAKIWPSMFAYQFVVEATRLDDLEDILARTVDSGKANETEAGQFISSK
ncbi:MAG: glycosyltransferase [Planctomycetota bacterium]|jgi:glycosyltransferase involved in cell wall biosynthesis